jgi:hypothetical protein
MKVFISWSGDQSRQIATALHGWLSMVIQAAKPYMSERDNEAGSRWGDVLAAQLKTTDFGIVCLTPENLESRWINFEAGALSKALDRAHVVPLLHNLRNSDVPPPLSQFMMKKADEAGIRDVVRALNASLDPERRMTEVALDGVFSAMWPALRSQLTRVTSASGTAASAKRSDRELLEEILSILRRKATEEPGGYGVDNWRRKPRAEDDPQWFDDLRGYLRNVLGPAARIDASGSVITVKVDRAPEDIASKLQTLPRIKAAIGEGFEVRVMFLGKDQRYIRVNP